MKSNEIQNKMKDMDFSRFIAGIHNYCDRWCERCPLTAKCSVFAMEQELYQGEGAKAVENKEFWEQLSEIFKATIEMVKEDMKKRGIDLEEIEIDTAEIISFDDIMKHPLQKKAREYTDGALFFIRKAEEEKMLATLSQHERDLAADSLDVITYYHIMISSKMSRALGSYLEMSAKASVDYETEAYDMNGSAKIMLIIIERSISAWGSLLKLLPQHEDLFFNLIKQLYQIKKESESLFPEAYEFIRPGFDE